MGDIVLCDKSGAIYKGAEGINPAQAAMAEVTNRRGVRGTLADAMRGADAFIGVSAPGCVSREMVESMAPRAIVFSCANPVPEISRKAALEAGAAVVGTGSSENPNQINNVLVFPGLFRGALDVRAKDINFEMMLAASRAIADYVGDKLSADFILPYAYDKGAHVAVAQAVAVAAAKSGAARR